MLLADFCREYISQVAVAGVVVAEIDFSREVFNIHGLGKCGHSFQFFVSLYKGVPVFELIFRRYRSSIPQS